MAETVSMFAYTEAVESRNATIAELRGRISQLESDNEQLRLSLQASAFLQEQSKVQRLTAENAKLEARLTAENAALREDNARLSSVDSDNAGLEYAADNDAQELSSLRERVAELEASGKDKLILLSNEARHRQHFEDQSKLLLECVRWCLKSGAYVDSRGNLWHDESGEMDYVSSPAPAHLAPLIAEAVNK